MCVQKNLEKNLLTSTNVVQKNFIGEKKFRNAIEVAQKIWDCTVSTLLDLFCHYDIFRTGSHVIKNQST